MNCPKCSFENKDGSKFCNECGHPLSGASSAAATADLSGLERLVSADYERPVASWRAGGTAEMPRVTGERRDVRTFQAPEDPEPSGGALRKVLAALLIVAVVAVAAAYLTYRAEVWGGKTVPNVVGASQADALYLLEGKGFKVRTLQVKSDDVEGIVLLMDPSAESRQEAGTEVVIHVSVPRVVPDVAGLPKPEVANLLKQEGFTNVSYMEVKSNDHEGRVLSIQPESGTKAKAGTAITVEVTVPYTVPAVAQLSQDEAAALLTAEGYQVELAWVYNEDLPEGTALSTEPAAGSDLAAGSTVTLQIAKSRATELVNATRSYFGSQELFIIGDETYQIDISTLKVAYKGENTVSYSLTARRAESHYWEVEDRWETKYGEPVTLEGTIDWDDRTNVLGGNPTIMRA